MCTRGENREERKRGSENKVSVVLRVSQPPVVYPTTRFPANRLSQRNCRHFVFEFFPRGLGLILESFLHYSVCHLEI